VLISEAVPPDPVPIRSGGVANSGGPVIAEAIQLPIEPAGGPEGDQGSDAVGKRSVGVPLGGDADGFARLGGCGLKRCDQHGHGQAEGVGPRVCVRLTHTRGRINFFGGVGGFFIKGGDRVTGGVTRYAFGNVVTVRYGRRLETVAISLLLDRRRAATVGRSGRLRTLGSPRQLRRHFGDEQRRGAGVEQLLKQSLVHAARAAQALTIWSFFADTLLHKGESR
jgi:hypothetical protein